MDNRSAAAINDSTTENNINVSTVENNNIENNKQEKIQLETPKSIKEINDPKLRLRVAYVIEELVKELDSSQLRAVRTKIWHIPDELCSQSPQTLRDVLAHIKIPADIEKLCIERALSLEDNVDQVLSIAWLLPFIKEILYWKKGEPLLTKRSIHGISKSEVDSESFHEASLEAGFELCSPLEYYEDPEWNDQTRTELSDVKLLKIHNLKMNSEMRFRRLVPQVSENSPSREENNDNNNQQQQQSNSNDEKDKKVVEAVGAKDRVLWLNSGNVLKDIQERYTKIKTEKEHPQSPHSVAELVEKFKEIDVHSSSVVKLARLLAIKLTVVPRAFPCYKTHPDLGFLFEEFDDPDVTMTDPSPFVHNNNNKNNSQSKPYNNFNRNNNSNYNNYNNNNNNNRYNNNKSGFKSNYTPPPNTKPKPAVTNNNNNVNNPAPPKPQEKFIAIPSAPPVNPWGKPSTPPPTSSSVENPNFPSISAQLSDSSNKNRNNNNNQRGGNRNNKKK